MQGCCTRVESLLVGHLVGQKEGAQLFGDFMAGEGKSLGITWSI
jgi:hypothetical protein